MVIMYLDYCERGRFFGDSKAYIRSSSDNNMKEGGDLKDFVENREHTDILHKPVETKDHYDMMRSSVQCEYICLSNEARAIRWYFV